MSNKLYDVLKTVEMTVLPAIGAFYNAIAHIWNLEETMHPVQVNETLGTVATFLGAVLLISSAKYKKELEQKEV